MIFQDYLGLAWVNFEIYLLKFIPVVDQVKIELFSLQAAVEHFPDEIVIWFFIELYGFGVVEKIVDL